MSLFVDFSPEISVEGYYSAYHELKLRNIRSASQLTTILWSRGISMENLGREGAPFGLYFFGDLVVKMLVDF